MIDSIIDINHSNPIDLHHAQQSGVVAVIHKATEGLGFTDPLYQHRRAIALAAGLAWGAYHFSTGDDGTRQADHFLAAVASGGEPEPHTLLALDWEHSTHGADMPLREAQAFAQRIFERTGRWPLVYGSDLLRESVSARKIDPVLSHCPLWIADYRRQVGKLPPTWQTWTLWQYTDGETGGQPRAVTGVVGADRNRFQGTREQLLARWPLTPPATHEKNGVEARPSNVLHA